MEKKGLLFVISAASGAGKTTVCKALLGSLPRLSFSVSATTRKIRRGEVDGRDYFFLLERQFKDKIKKAELAEWAKVHNYYYGTPKESISSIRSKGHDVLLEIDVQGGINIRKMYPGAVLIFIKTPSFEVLKERLKYRGLDGKKEITKRLDTAKRELKLLNEYDYVVVNDELKNAIEDVASIIQKERKDSRR
ncbi:MAG: guanylate kinase [bacterium]